MFTAMLLVALVILWTACERLRRIADEVSVVDASLQRLGELVRERFEPTPLEWGE